MRRRLPLLLVLLVSLLSGSGPARATGASLPGQAPAGLEDYLADLDSGDQARRRLAARSLRSMVRIEVRRSARSSDGPMAEDLSRQEALLALQDLDRRLAPRCREYLAAPAVTVPCADILRMLETTAALPELRAALPELRGRRARRVARAIETLEGYALEGRALESTPSESL